jgi:pimeloyl-ACP methyl ester carboxylesterase
MVASRLHANVQGKGTGVVLLHGYPFDGSIWQEQVNYLSKEAHIIAVDTPGFGQSLDLPGESKDATMDAYADTLAEVLKANGQNHVVLVGHSMGGYIAFAFMRRHGEMVKGLVLVATKAGADTEAGREGRYKQAAAVEERGAQAVVDAMLPKLFAPATYEQKPEIVEAVRKTMLNQNRHGIIAALHAMASRPDSTPGLADINVPTLIISGAEDAIMPAAEADTLHSHIRNSKHLSIEGAGHMLMLEQPDKFNEALSAFVADEK